MTAIDPFLYISLLGGFVAGRLVRRKIRWIETATIATVVLLIGLLGSTLSNVPVETLAATIPLAFGFAGLVLGVTVGLVAILPKPKGANGSSQASPRRELPIGFILLVALAVGYLVGRAVAVPSAGLITYSLYALLGLVGFDLRLSVRPLRNVWIPVLAAVAAAFLSAGLIILINASYARVLLPTALAFGWYSLAGPLVAAQLGGALGFFAFLSNFLRENLTMLLAPQIGSKVRGEGLAAMGGATAMDTTLYFVTRYGDTDAGSLALATGLTLTLLAGLLVPLFLSLSGA